jgi:hypothetical protein
VARTGAWKQTGVLETSWSRLWGALAGELRVPEAAALAIVARTPELAYDSQRDTITFEMTEEDG